MLSAIKPKPVNTSLRVLFASHYTIGCSTYMSLFMFRHMIPFGTISYRVYTVIYSEIGF